MTQTLHDEEVEAAELEGIVAIDDNPALMQLVFTYQVHRKSEKDSEAAKKSAGGGLMAAFVSANAVAFTIGGVVMARKQEPTTSRFNEKNFKADHPDLWEKYYEKNVPQEHRPWVHA